MMTPNVKNSETRYPYPFNEVALPREPRETISVTIGAIKGGSLKKVNSKLTNSSIDMEGETSGTAINIIPPNR